MKLRNEFYNLLEVEGFSTLRSRLINLVREADMTRKRRSKIVDKAAAYILQGALDAMRHL